VFVDLLAEFRHLFENDAFFRLLITITYREEMGQDDDE